MSRIWVNTNLRRRVKKKNQLGSGISIDLPHPRPHTSLLSWNFLSMPPHNSCQVSVGPFGWSEHNSAFLLATLSPFLLPPPLPPLCFHHMSSCCLPACLHACRPTDRGRGLGQRSAGAFIEAHYAQGSDVPGGGEEEVRGLVFKASHTHTNTQEKNYSKTQHTNLHTKMDTHSHAHIYM